MKRPPMKYRPGVVVVYLEGASYAEALQQVCEIGGWEVEAHNDENDVWWIGNIPVGHEEEIAGQLGKLPYVAATSREPVTEPPPSGGGLFSSPDRMRSRRAFHRSGQRGGTVPPGRTGCG